MVFSEIRQKLAEILEINNKVLANTQKAFPSYLKRRIDNNTPKNEKITINTTPCMLEKIIILKRGDADIVRLYDGGELFFESDMGEWDDEKKQRDLPKTIELNATCNNGLYAYLYCPEAYRHFKCDDINPNVIADSSKNRDNAVGNNMTGDNTHIGRVRQGVDLNGTDEQINAGNIANWLVTQSFTIAMWFRTEDLTGVRPLFRKGGAIFDCYAEAFAGYTEMNFRLFGTSGSLHIELKDIYEGLRWDNQEWLHFAVTYDGKGVTQGVKLYMNGKPAMSETITDDWVGFKVSGTDFLFGKLNANQFKGQFDDIRLYESELTAEQIMWLWNIDNRIAYGRGQQNDFKSSEFLLIYKK